MNKVLFGTMALIGCALGCGQASDVDSDEGAELGSTSAALTAPRTCLSSSQCPSGTHCSVDRECQAECPQGPCPAVCAGTCVSDAPAVMCGVTRCEEGELCCNPSCGICAPRGGACTQQLCSPGG